MKLQLIAILKFLGCQNFLIARLVFHTDIVWFGTNVESVNLDVPLFYVALRCLRKLDFSRGIVMASIRRTLSPVPRPGALINSEACQVASPLSKSSSNSQNYTPNDGLLASSTGSLDYALYRAQSFVLGLFSKRSARPFDRSKAKGHVWRRASFHFLMCFIAGVFVGLTPFASLHSCSNIVSVNRAFDFELLQPVMNEFNEWNKNVTSVVGRLLVNENSTSEAPRTNFELKMETLPKLF